MRADEKVPMLCVGGPLDGLEVCFETRYGFTQQSAKYQLAMDDTGERYWRFAGVVAKAA